MKCIILLCLSACLSDCLAGGQIINIENRNKTSLNGKWQVIVDPFENGFYNYQMEEDPNGYFQNAKPADKTERVEYAFTQDHTLLVPGDWNTQCERLFYYEGTIWYKRDFDYRKKKNTRLFVYFGAVNYSARVYCNGVKAGSHVGGFTPFNFEITDLVREGDNFLVIKADNRRLREGVPTVNTDWWNYGGLTRDVVLAEVPETFIQDYFIQLQKGSNKRIAGWIRLNGTKLAQTVTIEIPEIRLKKTFATRADGALEFAFDAKVIPWSPENPKLYDVKIGSETDRVSERIGFRTVETRGCDILLNGKPVYLRGVCLHEEAPFRSGRAFSREDARILLGWAKDLGCNFVRLAHYPHNENMTSLADETGMMVWSEIPVYWTVQWENPETLDNALNQLEEMIGRDKNKASVILWSVANETPICDARLKFLATLADRARKLDPTRLVTAALDRNRLNDTTMVVNDPLGGQLDVLGMNEYIGWYDGLPEKCGRMVWKTLYNKPHIMSEFGGGCLAGLHGDELTRWTEEYQENLYRQQVDMIRRIPFLRGACPWILMDFRSPRRPLYGIQDGFNRKGLVSDRGQKKKAYYVMRQFYREIAEK
jgi:beta-glucuronidase